MNETVRTFVAIEIPTAPLRDVLVELVDMGRPVRVGAEPLHLTLKFLGDTDRTVLDSVAAAITEVCSTHAPVNLEIAGLGTFPRPERPSVVWAGVSPVEPLAALAADLDRQLTPLGFPPEQRAFQPHVTLARVKGRPPQSLAEVMTLHSDARFGVACIDEVLFFQSILQASAPQYTALNRAPLSDTLP